MNFIFYKRDNGWSKFLHVRANLSPEIIYERPVSKRVCDVFVYRSRSHMTLNMHIFCRTTMIVKHRLQYSCEGCNNGLYFTCNLLCVCVYILKFTVLTVHVVSVYFNRQAQCRRWWVARSGSEHEEVTAISSSCCKGKVKCT